MIFKLKNFISYVNIFIYTIFFFIVFIFIAEIIFRNYFKEKVFPNIYEQKKYNLSHKEKIKMYYDNGDFWIDDYLKKQTNVNETKVIYDPYKAYKFDANKNYFKINKSNCASYKNVFIWGGSAVHGDGWLREEDLVHYQLGKIIENHNYDCIKVFNYGQSGYTSKQNFISFFESQNYENSIHIFYEGINDFIWGIYKDEQHLVSKKMKFFFDNYLQTDLIEQIKSIVKTTINNLYIIQFFKKKIKNESIKFSSEQIKDKLVTKCVSWSNRSLAINNFLNDKNSKAIFIWQNIIVNAKNLKPLELKIKKITSEYLGDIFKGYILMYKTCNEYFNKNNIKLFKLEDLESNKKTLFFDYVHLNPHGNKIISNNIYEIINNDL